MERKRPGFVRVASRGDLAPGRGKLVVAHGKPMALFNVDGEFYAINYICPHMGGPLGEGKFIEKYVIECPWHRWTFDVRTGLPDHEDGHSVAAYEVKVEGDDIFVGWLKRVSD